MASATIAVRGLKELNRDFRKMSKELSKELRDELKEAGDLVRAESARLFSRYDAGSAAGYKVRVRQGGVAVEQSRRRVTGKRGDYGALQMRRALEPGLTAKQDEVFRRVDKMLGHLAGSNGF